MKLLLSSLAYLFSVVVTFAVVVGLIMYMPEQEQAVYRYDCRLSEISPDYPIEVKDACRNLRKNTL